MSLRPYQLELVEKLRQSWRTGHKAPCIVLPCGGGKSVIVAEIAKRTTDSGKNVLFLVHRKELQEQIRDTFRWWGVDMDFCNVMMVQTASRRIQKLERPSLIITDENHHSKATSYKKIYEAFPEAYRVGVTATPTRIDGSGLSDVNDDLIMGVSAKWLIDNSFLAHYEYYAPSMLDMSGVKTARNGDFDMKQAEEALKENCVYGDVIKHYREHANGKKAVCYCTSISYSKAIAEQFKESGISAAHIDGETPTSERDSVIQKFRDGEIQILCNVDLISEGFDVPDCECAILLRPTKSLTLYIQQSMRCMRYKDGKTAIILDHVGNVRRFGMPDDDREWSLETREKKKAEEFEITSCDFCYFTFPKKDKNGKMVKKCPNCGAMLNAKAEEGSADREPEVKKESVLERVTDVHVIIPPLPQQCRSMNDLVAYGKAKGYKPGWAYIQGKKMGFVK